MVHNHIVKRLSPDIGWALKEDSGTALTSTSYTGVDLNGIDGDTNRTLAFVNNISMIFLDGMFLHPNIDWTQTSGVVTFVTTVFNSQLITIFN